MENLFQMQNLASGGDTSPLNDSSESMVQDMQDCLELLDQAQKKVRNKTVVLTQHHLICSLLICHPVSKKVFRTLQCVDTNEIEVRPLDIMLLTLLRRR